MYKTFFVLMLWGSAWSLDPIDRISNLNKDFKTVRSSYEGKIDQNLFDEGQKVLNGTTYKVSNDHYANSAERQEAFTFCLHRALHQSQKPTYTLNSTAPLEHTAALYVYEWVAYYLAKKPEFLFKADSLWDKIQTKRRKSNHFTKRLNLAQQRNFTLKSKINDYLETSCLLRLFRGISLSQILRETVKGTYDYFYEWLATALDIYENPQKKRLKVRPSEDDHAQGYQIIYNDDDYPVALLKPKTTQNPKRIADNRPRQVAVELEATKFAQTTGFASVISEVFDYKDNFTIEPYLSLVPALHQNNRTSDTLVHFFYRAMTYMSDPHAIKKETLHSLKKKVWPTFYLRFFFEEKIKNKYTEYTIDNDFIPDKTRILKANDPSNLALFVGAMGVLDLYDAHDGNVALQIVPNMKLKYTHYDLEYALGHPNPTGAYEVNLPLVLMGQHLSSIPMPGSVPSVLKKPRFLQHQKFEKAVQFWNEAYWNELPVHTLAFLYWQNPQWQELLLLMSASRMSARSQYLTYWDPMVTDKKELIIDNYQGVSFQKTWLPNFVIYVIPQLRRLGFDVPAVIPFSDKVEVFQAFLNVLNLKMQLKAVIRP